MSKIPRRQGKFGGKELPLKGPLSVPEAILSYRGQVVGGKGPRQCQQSPFKTATVEEEGLTAL